MTAPQATWHATADATGHAFLAGPAGLRSLCGEVRRQPERFDHPIEVRCMRCTAELNRRVKAAILEDLGDGVVVLSMDDLVEGELRALFGDR